MLCGCDYGRGTLLGPWKRLFLRGEAEDKWSFSLRGEAEQRQNRLPTNAIFTLYIIKITKHLLYCRWFYYLSSIFWHKKFLSPNPLRITRFSFEISRIVMITAIKVSLEVENSWIFHCVSAAVFYCQKRREKSAAMQPT